MLKNTGVRRERNLDKCGLPSCSDFNPSEFWSLDSLSQLANRRSDELRRFHPTDPRYREREQHAGAQSYELAVSTNLRSLPRPKIAV